jgi:RNA polymerase sigma-70 factor (ECF subfamily)
MYAMAESSDAIRELMVKHGPSVLASVTRLVQDRALAEDVLQETLVRAWRNLDRLTASRIPVRAWLLRVARNIAVDQFRARKARPVEVVESAAVGLGVPDPADELLQALQVRAALAQLSEAHRAVLRECYFRGSTITEAAQTLGLPIGTVKSRLYSALRILRGRLVEAAEAA